MQEIRSFKLVQRRVLRSAQYRVGANWKSAVIETKKGSGRGRSKNKQISATSTSNMIFCTPLISIAFPNFINHQLSLLYERCLLDARVSIPPPRGGIGQMQPVSCKKKQAREALRTLILADPELFTALLCCLASREICFTLQPI